MRACACVCGCMRVRVRVCVRVTCFGPLRLSALCASTLSLDVFVSTCPCRHPFFHARRWFRAFPMMRRLCCWSLSASCLPIHFGSSARVRKASARRLLVLSPSGYLCLHVTVMFSHPFTWFLSRYLPLLLVLRMLSPLPLVCRPPSSLSDHLSVLNSNVVLLYCLHFVNIFVSWPPPRC